MILKVKEKQKIGLSLEQIAKVRISEPLPPKMIDTSQCFPVWTASDLERTIWVLTDSMIAIEHLTLIKDRNMRLTVRLTRRTTTLQYIRPFDLLEEDLSQYQLRQLEIRIPSREAEKRRVPGDVIIEHAQPAPYVRVSAQNRPRSTRRQSPIFLSRLSGHQRAPLNLKRLEQPQFRKFPCHRLMITLAL